MDFHARAVRASSVPMMTAGPAVLKNSLRCVLLGIDTLAPSAIFGERSPPYIQRGFALTLWRVLPPGDPESARLHSPHARLVDAAVRLNKKTKDRARARRPAPPG